jgi:hypothetical protein
MIARLRAALLWAGPLGVGGAIALLLVSAPFFRTGPDTATAGDERAWSAMWGAIALLATGSLLGLTANGVWLVWAARARRRPSAHEWLRVALNLVVGGGFLWLWFRR